MNLESSPPSIDLPPMALQQALRDAHRLAQSNDAEALGSILELIAAAIGVSRASVWGLAPGAVSLDCQLMFERGVGVHELKASLPCESAPIYFSAIEGLLVLAADDVLNDPRTSELRDSYMKPMGIGAMLDVPICEFGEIVGVLCLEHVGPARVWTSAEKLFVSSMSGVLSQRRDRLRLAAAEDEREKQMLYDDATGFAGRGLFVDRLGSAIRDLPAGQELAVLALDIERLRTMAHRYGGDFANAVMAEAAARIHHIVPTHCCARIADDTLALWLTGPRVHGAAVRLAGRLQRALALPMTAPDGDSIEFSTAVGIVPGTRDETDPDRLLRDALTAAFSAARKGRGRVEVVWTDARHELQSSLDLERDVRRAADAREFEFRLQPIVRLSDGQAVGAEALMRWPRAGREVSPADFIPVLEETGLIAQVHSQLLRDLFAWARHVRILERVPGFQLHVNFSPVQLGHSTFVAELRDTARSYGLEGLLVCEVTENTLLSAGDDAGSTLKYLGEMGIPVTLDDFGTGFASLTHLIDLPLHGLKIDRSFCLRCADDLRARAVVGGLLGLAHHLKLDVVAEGVETEEHRRILIELGCEVAQGYLFDRALPLAEFAKRWLSH